MKKLAFLILFFSSSSNLKAQIDIQTKSEVRKLIIDAATKAQYADSSYTNLINSAEALLKANSTEFIPPIKDWKIYLRAIYILKRGNPIEAIKLFERVLAETMQNKNLKNYDLIRARSHMFLGECFASPLHPESNYEKAFQHYLKADTLFQESQDITNEMNLKIEIGELYFEQKRYAKALDYYFKFLRYNKSLKNQSTPPTLNAYCVIFYNIGNTYFEMEEYTTALTYLEKAISYAELSTPLRIEKIPDNPEIEVGILPNGIPIIIESPQKEHQQYIAYETSLIHLKMLMAHAYYRRREEGDLAKATELLNQWNTQERKDMHPFDKARWMIINSSIVAKAGRYQEALSYLKDCEQRLVVYPDNSMSKELYKAFGFTYKQLGKIDSSVIYFEKLITLQDSSLHEEQLQKLQTLTDKYEIKEVETAKELAKLEREEAELQKKQKLLFGSLAAILLSFLIVIIFFNQRLKKQKQEISNQKERIEKDKNKIELLSKVVGHDAANVFEDIAIDLKSVRKRIEDKAILEEIQPVEQDSFASSKFFREVFKSGNDFTAINTSEFIKNKIDFYIKHFNCVDAKINYSSLPKNSFLDSITALKLDLVLREIIRNSKKYAMVKNKKKIPLNFNIRYSEKKGKPILSIKDNGTGFHPPEILKWEYPVNGLEMIRDLVVDDLKGNLKLENERGAKYKIESPIFAPNAEATF